MAKESKEWVKGFTDAGTGTRPEEYVARPLEEQIATLYERLGIKPSGKSEQSGRGI